MSKQYSFKDFLVDEFNSTYRGTDDSAPEATERFIQELTLSEQMEYAISYYDKYFEQDDAIAMREFFFKLLDK